MTATKSSLEPLKSNPEVLRIYSKRILIDKDGNRYVGLCPFHDEKTASFTVSLKDGKWLYYCFGCHAKGSIVDFVSRHDKVSIPEAIKIIESELTNTWKSNKELVEGTFGNKLQTENKKIVLTLDKYYPFEQALYNNKKAQEWLLNERGIDYETARRLHIGYRSNVGKLAGNNNGDIQNAGWVTFPIIRNGFVIGIKYRSIVRKVFFHQSGMSSGVFNMDCIDPLETLFITEGEFDAASLVRAGFRAISLPSASTRLTEEKDFITEANTIVLAGDMDSQGQECMNKLWNELQDRTYLLQWPDGLKDANEVLMTKCGGDVEEFRKVVKELLNTAKSNPMPHVFSMPEVMLSANRTNLVDHPLRMRAPWKAVDEMAILLPGSVVSISATNTKMGKTAFLAEWTTENSIQHDDVILNYQCELTQDEFANIQAAHLLKRDRNKLTPEDYIEASKKLANAKYYVGRNPTLTTVSPVLDLIEAAIRRLGATIVVLDHLHFICRNEQNEIQAQSNAMQRIKNMAIKYGVKFIVVMQPRKAGATTRGKMIHITDFKGSESNTSDADAIFVIHRDVIRDKDPNNPPMDDYESRTEIHLLGARAKGNGPTFALLEFMGKWATFVEYTNQDQPADFKETLYG